MPFCRHCGDLVLKDRCGKCGGRPVAASFSWASGKTKAESPDRWKQIYTTDDSPKREEVDVQPEPSSSRPAASKPPLISTPARRFPRPHNSTAINNRMSAHIAATTSERTPSPTKQLSNAQALADTLNSSPSSNPVLDDGVTLSKVYGSVLQNPESLKSYACASCNDIFTRDATLYPDPDEPTRMLCRHCFLATSGTKGECAGCSKSVVRLRQEGQFVENSGKVWHKKCFVCNGCSKNIAANPSVDLYGRPCCPGCFDTSLSRPVQSKPNTPRVSDAKAGNLGGLSESTQDGSAALEELSRRLGVKSRESTPSRTSEEDPTTPQSKTPVQTVRSPAERAAARRSLDDLSRRLRATTLDEASLRRTSRDAFGSNADDATTSSSNYDSPPKPSLPTRSTPSSARRQALQLNTPDLTSDVSDDAESSWPSPPTPKADAPPSSEDADAQCDECKKPLFSIVGGGRIVSAPTESGYVARFHGGCFMCTFCRKPFAEKEGTANYVITESGFSHLQCAPAPKPKIVTRQRPVSVMPLPRPEPPVHAQTVPRPVSSLGTASATSTTSATSTGGFAFPNKHRCAGCDKMVAVMEPGVVAGPRGTRWHAGCLVCGGKGSRKRGEPGCGKRLDRDAKLDQEGKTWCSNCMTLLILNGSANSAPLKTPVSAVFPAGGWLNSQGTGSSVASHFTGSSTSTVHNQSTGTTRPLSTIESNPTADTLAMLQRRSVSPTKGMLGGTVPVNRTYSFRKGNRPRPKSVSVLPRFGVAGTGGYGPSVELVRESTGASSVSSQYTDDSASH
ncbi:hypothetical protein M408DRAFT_325503 [Serendipita vermifera MAFF 305830]|uniref:LIM zinc-binding domain-containing protein n=1 Tax=Serendipita vermifera MAFF 305830 TaxID=933852 RepID=A0A0C2X783_SERVB|nr:hypothetical protein M408DRAFT_325503 [Serendipita vermifera MAFF 305830]